ncbi:UNVERIFIED_CONTAM: Lecithin-cholesterol acyltransferase-like 1 [Sesamum radiatum]|uniref:Lecithin-cholesterol acyltransferase-like 1 n=1 Tax=Sesamum radiatum TaxID=300843 RepID=A0AAW2IMT3_SESRA
MSEVPSTPLPFHILPNAVLFSLLHLTQHFKFLRHEPSPYTHKTGHFISSCDGFHLQICIIHQQPASGDLSTRSGGNQLEARLTAEYKSSSLLCSRWYPLKKDPDGWFRLWFDPTVLFKPFTKCFNERMMIYYDPDVDDYHNAPGVETRVPDFGSTQGLLYLNPNLK